METINNAMTSASKAIWGEQQNPATATSTGNETAGEEPVSGLQGKGSVNEPFDQGNALNPTDPAGKSNVADSTSTSTSGPTPDLKPYSTSERESSTFKTEPSMSQREPSTFKTEPSMSQRESSTFKSEPSMSQREPSTFKTEPSMSQREPATSNFDTPSGAEIPMNPNNAAAGGTPNPLENTEGTGVTGSSAQKYAPKGSDVVPSASSNNPGVAPASGAAPSQKHQGADRPTEAPSDSRKEDDPDAILKKRDPNDHSGEPMHMHGGTETKIANTQAERRESKVGNPGGQEHGKEHGTGSHWVKTSGLAADGGDFDATKPGAGREADRLLEEKGIHRDAKGAMDNPDVASTGSDHKDHKDKVSKMDKIKDKLHIGGSKDK